MGTFSGTEAFLLFRPMGAGCSGVPGAGIDLFFCANYRRTAFHTHVEEEVDKV